MYVCVWVGVCVCVCVYMYSNKTFVCFDNCTKWDLMYRTVYVCKFVELLLFIKQRTKKSRQQKWRSIPRSTSVCVCVYLRLTHKKDCAGMLRLVIWQRTTRIIIRRLSLLPQWFQTCVWATSTAAWTKKESVKWNRVPLPTHKHTH